MVYEKLPEFSGTLTVKDEDNTEPSQMAGATTKCTLKRVEAGSIQEWIKI